MVFNIADMYKKITLQFHKTSHKYCLTYVNFVMAYWWQMATEIWVNIGSGNGLLPDGTKPLPEPMLTYQ